MNGLPEDIREMGLPDIGAGLKHMWREPMLGKAPATEESEKQVRETWSGSYQAVNLNGMEAGKRVANEIKVGCWGSKTQYIFQECWVAENTRRAGLGC